MKPAGRDRLDEPTDRNVAFADDARAHSVADRRIIAVAELAEKTEAPTSHGTAHEHRTRVEAAGGDLPDDASYGNVARRKNARTGTVTDVIRTVVAEPAKSSLTPTSNRPAHHQSARVTEGRDLSGWPPERYVAGLDDAAPNSVTDIRRRIIPQAARSPAAHVPVLEQGACISRARCELHDGCADRDVTRFHDSSADAVTDILGAVISKRSS
jgi:hypothetical protein